jgi:hypothetical protein
MIFGGGAPAAEKPPESLPAFRGYMERLCTRGAVRALLNYTQTQAHQQAQTETGQKAGQKGQEEKGDSRRVLSRSTGGEWTCLICGDERPDVARLARACQCEARPCGGHECRCHVVADVFADDVVAVEETEDKRGEKAERNSSAGAGETGATAEESGQKAADDDDTTDATAEEVTAALESLDPSSTSGGGELSEGAAPGDPVPVSELPVFRACKDCVFQCLWSQTSSALRENGTFRAQCPFCKAEFCAHDVVLIRWPEDEEKLRRQQANARGSQRGRRGGKRGRGGRRR